MNEVGMSARELVFPSFGDEIDRLTKAVTAIEDSLGESESSMTIAMAEMPPDDAGSETGEVLKGNILGLRHQTERLERMQPALSAIVKMVH